MQIKTWYILLFSMRYPTRGRVDRHDGRVGDMIAFSGQLELCALPRLID